MSSAASVPVASYPWPADVLAFAAKQNVAQYLEPLLQATRQLFPTAQVKVFFERDMEYPDEQYIVFEVNVPRADIPDYLAADRKWRHETLRVCPAPVHWAFVFSLEQVM
jgi:hypothetical protein